MATFRLLAKLLSGVRVCFTIKRVVDRNLPLLEIEIDGRDYLLRCSRGLSLSLLSWMGRNGIDAETLAGVKVEAQKVGHTVHYHVTRAVSSVG